MKKSIGPLQAILFDMDGTLVNSTPAVEICWKAWAIRHSLSVDHVLHYIHGRPARDSVRALAPHADEEAEVNWMLERELAEYDGVAAIPGALAMLQSLGSFPWAIVTSADRRLALHRLKLAGITPPAVMITVNDVIRGKPDPEGFLKAAQLLGVNPAECLVAEDTPAGLAAGRAAGMQLLGLATTFTADKLPCDITTKDYFSVSFQAAERKVVVGIA